MVLLAAASTMNGYHYRSIHFPNEFQIIYQFCFQSCHHHHREDSILSEVIQLLLVKKLDKIIHIKPYSNHSLNHDHS